MYLLKHIFERDRAYRKKEERKLFVVRDINKICINKYSQIKCTMNTK